MSGQTHTADVAPPRVAPLAPARRTDEPALLACLAVVVLGALWLGVLAGPDAPGEGSADVGFARDMATHHEQAVAMAEAIRARSSGDDVAVLATDIALTQQAQIGRMRGWLDTWGVAPTGRELPMAWMGHPAGGPMPGMASRAEVAGLAEGAAADAEVAFLRLMIRHHQGGVSMAEGASARARTGEVRRLAEGIISAQQSEITLMSDMLRARGAAPFADAPRMPAMDAAADAAPVWRATARLAPVGAAVLAAAWLVADGAWRRRLWVGPVRWRPLRTRWTPLPAAAALAVAGAVHLGLAAADVPVDGESLYVAVAFVELGLAALAAAWPLPAARLVVAAAAFAVFALTLGTAAVGKDNPPAAVALAAGAAQVLAAVASAGAAVAAGPGGEL